MTNNSKEEMNPDRNISRSAEEEVECPVCLQTAVHPTKLPCGHVFCYLCLKGVVIISHRCALCRRETSKESIDHPQLVNGLSSVKNIKPLEDGFQWFYEGRNGWWQYDERTSNEVEKAYKASEKTCTIFVAGVIYIVDFETMMQRRQNNPGKKRSVKRDLAVVPKKGIAGIRLEENVTRGTNVATTTIPSVPPPPPPPPPAPISSLPVTTSTASSFLQYFSGRNISFSGFIDLTRNRNNNYNSNNISINNQPGSSGLNNTMRYSNTNNDSSTQTTQNNDRISSNSTGNQNGYHYNVYDDGILPRPWIRTTTPIPVIDIYDDSDSDHA